MQYQSRTIPNPCHVAAIEGARALRRVDTEVVNEALERLLGRNWQLIKDGVMAGAAMVVEANIDRLERN
jgi:hypothetical protein